MRWCLLDREGFKRWQRAAQMSSIGDLKDLSRYMERIYEGIIYYKSFASAMDLARQTKAAGDARARVVA